MSALLFLKQELQTLHDYGVVTLADCIMPTVGVQWNSDRLHIRCMGKEMMILTDDADYDCCFPCFPPLCEYVSRTAGPVTGDGFKPAVFVVKRTALSILCSGITASSIAFAGDLTRDDCFLEFECAELPDTFSMQTRCRACVRAFVRAFVAVCLERPGIPFPRKVDYEQFADV